MTAELLTPEQHAMVLASRPKARVRGGPACGIDGIEAVMRQFTYTPVEPRLDPPRRHLYTLAHERGELVYVHSFIDLAPQAPKECP